MICWCLTSQSGAVIALNERTLRGDFFFPPKRVHFNFSLSLVCRVRAAVQVVLLDMLL